jgi:protein-S-isoprenylcysteine O-methyltransferase Ste14
MLKVYICIVICAIILIANGICIVHATRNHITSEIYMHTGLTLFFSLLTLELTIGFHKAWTHYDIFWLEIIGWILYIPSAVLVIGSMIALHHKGKPESADFTDSTIFIDSGIYKLIRQPMTLGLAIWSIALVLVFQSLLAAILGLLSLFCFWMSARKEGTYNIRKFGDNYKEYMKKVPLWNFCKRIGK